MLTSEIGIQYITVHSEQQIRNYIHMQAEYRERGNTRKLIDSRHVGTKMLSYVMRHAVPMI